MCLIMQNFSYNIGDEKIEAPEPHAVRKIGMCGPAKYFQNLICFIDFFQQYMIK